MQKLSGKEKFAYSAGMIDRICLVTPPSIFLLDERVFMTLGILKVAAVLERAGVHVEMLDLSGVENYEDVVRDHVRNCSAPCYGLTATTPQMPAATNIVRAIRSLNGSARIILGGPHVTLVHAAARHERKRGVRGRADGRTPPAERPTRCPGRRRRRGCASSRRSAGIRQRSSTPTTRSRGCS